MSTLVVIGFSESHKAEELRAKLETLQSRHLLDLAEVVVATSDEHSKIKLHHAGDLTNADRAYGSLCASLANLVLMNATAGSVTGALAEVGITDHFMKGLAATLTPGGSAIFALNRTPSPDSEQILEELHGLGGKVLMTSLAHDDEGKLQAALSGEKS